MVIILIIWSFLYYVYEVFVGVESFNLLTFFKKMYYDYWNFSYWYIYCYIAFLISLPFLRALVNKLENIYFYYMFSIAFVTLSIIPTLQYLLSNNEYKMVGALNIGWLTTNFVLYPCLGYFLEHRINLNKKTVIIMWIINIITIGISSFLTYYKTINTGSCNEDFHNTFVIVNCITIFITIKYIFNRLNIPDIFKKTITSVGGCAFGIYLMHIFFMRKFKWSMKMFIPINNVINNEIISAFIYCFVIMCICYLITIVLKKIPIIKKII